MKWLMLVAVGSSPAWAIDPIFFKACIAKPAQVFFGSRTPSPSPAASPSSASLSHAVDRVEITPLEDWIKEKLELADKDSSARGHSLEARIAATKKLFEDPRVAGALEWVTLVPNHRQVLYNFKGEILHELDFKKDEEYEAFRKMYDTDQDRGHPHWTEGLPLPPNLAAEFEHVPERFEVQRHDPVPEDNLLFTPVVVTNEHYIRRPNKNGTPELERSSRNRSRSSPPPLSGQGRQVVSMLNGARQRLSLSLSQSADITDTAIDEVKNLLENRTARSLLRSIDFQRRAPDQYSVKYNFGFGPHFGLSFQIVGEDSYQRFRHMYGNSGDQANCPLPASMANQFDLWTDPVNPNHEAYSRRN